MHSHLTYLVFFIGCLALISTLILAVASLRARRRNLKAPFRDYFATQFERDYPKHRRFTGIDD